MPESNIGNSGSVNVTSEMLSNEQFEAIKSLIYDVAGITLATHKAQMVSNRIAKRVKALSLKGYDAYIEYLENKDNLQNEIPDLVNVLTTNVTHFFRENHHFEHMKQLLIDRIKTYPDKKIRIWSAGCSSGQEPYSIAITCFDAMKEAGKKADIRILATDIDTTILEKARKGIYNKEHLKGVSEEYLKRYFLKNDEHTGAFMVKPELRNMIAFNHLNLNLNTWPMNGKFQVIFCRNVLIYFDREKQKTIVSKMTRHMEQGSYLYLGHSEHYAGTHEKIVSKGQTIYEYKGI